MSSTIPMSDFLEEFEGSFGKLQDPRQVKKITHPLMNVLLIGFTTLLCGGSGWKEMELFGYAKTRFFEGLLNLSEGIPSPDTFRRVFSHLNPLEVQSCFGQWVRSSYGDLIPGDTLAIDGKVLRGTHLKGSHHWTHLVHAWCSELGVCLGQEKVDKKSNEITAIPQLLRTLEIAGCVVTLDAMGCQHEICQQIVDQGGDYLIGLKENQPALVQQAEKLFEVQPANDQHTTVEKGHGRIETRNCEVITDLRWMDVETAWKKAQIGALVKVVATRERKDKLSTQTRYYISSYKPKAQDALQRTRKHWGVENDLHWLLDVAFKEDACQIKKDHAPENLAIFRKMALHLLKHGPYSKGGIEARRKRAGWDEEYLLHLILNLGYL